MRRLAFTLLTALIVLSGLTITSNVHASTLISGTLTLDTTWTKESSPYEFSGTVKVANGATLTIEPGAVVNFGNHRLEINGTLTAKGDSAEKIVFNSDPQFGGEITFTQHSTSWSEQTGQGCIVENTVFNSIILFIRGSPLINNCDINNTILVSGSSPKITNCNINLNGTGINVISGGLTLNDNIIKGNGFSMGIFGSGTVVISKNIISHFDRGIKAYSGTFQITENKITQCRNGIEVSVDTTAIIQRNLIDNNTENGIICGRPIIESNTITNNGVGINNPVAEAVIRNNNILGNLVNSITATTSDVDASYNYWGTTDLEAINKTIYDKKVDNALGTITFTPILNASSSSAPAIPETVNTPIATLPPTDTSPPSVQPTPTYMPMPTRDPNVQRTGRDQAAPWYSLNMLVLAVAVPLIVAWIIVILGYSLKAKINRFLS